MSEVKRMRYFKEEFLKNEDFIDEQEYHRRMRYRHNRDFHTWGIGDGLEVTFTPGDHSVNISPGIAIDGEGKEIVLGESRILDFNEAGYEGGKSYYITIIWSQEEGEPRQENEAKRWVETPGINTSKTLPAQPELALVLALVTLNPDRTIAAVVDPGRHYAQIGIPDGSVTEAKLADNAVTSVKIKDGSIGTSTLVDKAVTRAKIGDASVNEEKLSTSVQAKLVTNGNSHDHSGGDGAQIKHSYLNFDDGSNPHNTKADDVGALSLEEGGTVEGEVKINNNVKIYREGEPLGGILQVTGGVEVYNKPLEKGLTGYINLGKIGEDNSISNFWHLQHRAGELYNNKFFIYHVDPINNNWTHTFTITPQGFVGIGTQEPSQPFHVINQNQTPCLLESTGPANRLQLTTIEGPAHRVEFCNIGEGRAAISVTGFGNALTVTQLGNVGIKTENPAYTLHTNGISYADQRAGASIDYAEYFESMNGNEIEPGTSVVLDGDKIRPAKKGEHPFGIISANPLIAGGVTIEWPKKYLRDEFGNQIMEEYKEEMMAPKKEKVKKERQKMEKKKIKETITKTEIAFEDGKYFQKEIKETVEKEIEVPVFKEVDLYDAQKKDIIGKHRIPVMETYEEEIDVLDEKGQSVMKGTGKFETKTRPKINPEYDETKEYIPREKRPEWNCVGLLGQLSLRKGQPVAPTWIKIKDISKDVELWLVK